MNKIPENWKLTIASEYCSSVRDGTHTSPKFVDQGYPLVTSKNIKGGLIDIENTSHISQTDFDAINLRSQVEQWDVLFSMIGTVGEISLVTTQHINFAIKNLGLFKCSCEEDGRWLSFWLRSSQSKIYVSERLKGTSQQYISLGELRNLPVLEPRDKGLRSKILNFLQQYENSIENNRRRIALLEESARLLYREWFVNLRFPGYESAKFANAIPDGWSLKPMSEIAIINRASLNSKHHPEQIQYIDISSVETGIITLPAKIPFIEAPGRARRLVQHGDVIWSCVRPNRRSYAMIWEPDNDVVVSTGFAVLTAKGVPFTYLYLACTSDEFVMYLTNRATGAAYPAVTGSDFNEAQILCPNQDILMNFHERCLPLFELLNNLQHQNVLLTEARNALLPKLMSGEIQV